MELLYMTRARGVSQTPRNTRHEAKNFWQDKNEKQNIYACDIRFKIKIYTWKYQNLVSEQMTRYNKKQVDNKMKLTFLIKLMTQVVIESGQDLWSVP